MIAQTNQQLKHPMGEPTLQWFWVHAYLPSRTWGPAMKSAVTSVVTRHVLPKFGQEKLSALDKLALQQHLNALAESYSRSLVKKVLVQYRAVLEEAVDQGILDPNQNQVGHRLLAVSKRGNHYRLYRLYPLQN